MAYPTTQDDTNAVLFATRELNRPVFNLLETWQDEAGINAGVWTVTNSVGGPGWSRGASGAYLRATEVPIADNECRICSKQRWIVAPTIFSNNTVLRRTTLEFELKLTTVANIDNTRSFLGFTPAVVNLRTTNNILGWALTSDALQTLSDLATAETTHTGFGETIDDWNKLAIDIYENHAMFYLNDVPVADHITNLPDLPMYLNFYIDTEAGGAATIELGIIRLWHEDIRR